MDILSIHGLLGCDTTTRVYGFGKGASLKKYTSSRYFRDQAVPFRDYADTGAIVAPGASALVCLYGGKDGEGLDSIRYNSGKVSWVSIHIIGDGV